jgi:cysteine desulfuration protein SufE
MNKSQTIAAQFPQTEAWEDRYKFIIGKGKELPELPESERLDKFLIKGCQSRVWLIPAFDGKTLTFKTDSDAAIVKGIVALVVEFYNGMTPDEILSQPPHFLDELGIREHLSMSRRNGLSHVLKQIQLYAAVFKAMQKPQA